MNLTEILRYQRDRHMDGGVYKACQCDFAYNSNHIEGSTLTHDQTVMVFDRNTFSGTAAVDDIVQARNHFTAFDRILDTADEPLSASYLCELHGILKAGTIDAANPVMAVGAFKLMDNVIGGIAEVPTASVAETPRLVNALIDRYERIQRPVERDLITFHYELEAIHPFSDGNGRVGRLVLFKECLRHGLTPFIITEDLREFYIRGLREYNREPGYLIDTCLTAQDRFAARYLPLAESFAAALVRTLRDKNDEG